MYKIENEAGGTKLHQTTSQPTSPPNTHPPHPEIGLVTKTAVDPLYNQGAEYTLGPLTIIAKVARFMTICFRPAPVAHPTLAIVILVVTPT